MFRRTIRIGSSTLPPNDTKLIFAMLNISHLLKRRCEYTESENMVRSILQSLKLSGKSTGTHAFAARELLVELLFIKGDPEVEMVLRADLQEFTKILGSENPQTLFIQGGLAQELCRTGRDEEGMSLFNDAIRKSVNAHGDKQSGTLVLQLNLAMVFLEQNDFSQAETLVENVSLLARKTFRPHDFISNHASYLLGKCYYGQGKLEEAVRILENVMEKMKETKPPGYWLVRRCAFLVSEVRRDIRLRNGSMLYDDKMR